MTQRRRSLGATHVALGCAISIFGFVACGDQAPPETHSTKKAPDQADVPGLKEGPLVAFGIHFPFRTTVARQTSNAITVEIPYPMEDVSNYFRARLTPKAVDVGPRRTIFHESRLVGDKPGLFEVIISRESNETKVTMVAKRDPSEKPPPASTIAAPNLPLTNFPPEPLPPPAPPPPPPPPEEE